MKKIFFCLFVIFIAQKSFGQDRRPSTPYISGDTFRSFADFIYDETNRSFSPEKVPPGAVVFVKTDYLEEFFKYFHPRILFRYILISHNSDHPVTSTFAPALEDDKLIAWFGQNVEYSHPKLHPIPIGIANRYVGHGNTAALDDVRRRLSIFSKDVLVYMNFAVGNCPLERSLVYDLFICQPFCLTSSATKNFHAYLIDLARSKFVLSPRGNGIDCHRTWEALYMGAYPVVKSSTLDPLYEGLPVIIVDDWYDVTEDFLLKKNEEMERKEFSWEKLNAQYWFKRINAYKI